MEQKPIPMNSTFINRSIKRYIFILSCLLVLTVAFFMLSLLLGEGNILTLPDKELAKKIIVLQRIPQSVAALFCGASLAVAGLILQSWFRNPLAESSILGISSGASFGIALITMGKSISFFAATNSIFGILEFAVAPIGALVVILILLSFASRSQNGITIILLGIMISYLTNALTSLLIHFSLAESVKNFINWSFGSFSSIAINHLPFLVVPLLVTLIGGAFLAPGLNILILGNENASASGLAIKPFQLILLLTVAIISGTTTLFCGPIAFIGIAAPHFARMLLQSADHKKLYPVSLLFGSILALLSDIVSRKISHSPLPINTILALVGVPILFSMMIKQFRPTLKPSINIEENDEVSFVEVEAEDGFHITKKSSPLSLEISSLQAKVSGGLLFNGENLKLESGKLTALVGDNGSGKTTFIKMLFGFIKEGKLQIKLTDFASDNKMEFDYQKWKKISPKKRAQILSVVFSMREEPSLLTAFDLIAFSLLPESFLLFPLSAKVSPKVQRHIFNCLEKVGLKQLAFREVKFLSDGEYRRLLIAKAIAQETPVIILDEPLAFLDTKNRLLILGLLKELASEGKTILFSSHEKELIANYADQIFIIHNKEIRATHQS